jgi:alkanesulfonate monooxygenase SsuD/methylene tetrahydromethanopterin reductase-like flavin-dependent oxidoreductase (luciferase family)
MSAIEFQLYLPQMRMPHAAIVEKALVAEASGFTGIAFMDHMAPPLAFQHEMWEAMDIASWVLAKTTTLKAGHLVLCDAFRHPALLARQVTSLDHASGGRFELGIGWGSVPDELERFGVGSKEPRQRVDRLAESLQVMRALWTGEDVTFEGEFFTLSRARQQPVPSRPVPITIGGVGKRTLALVREHADWWNLPVTELARMSELRDQAGDARVSIQARVGLVTSEEQRAEVTALDEKRFAGTKMRTNTVIGTPDELVDHFGQLHASGIDRFYVWFLDFAPVETLHRFGDVIRAFAG